MKRAYESLLHEYLTHFPCVALIGPRQCGKTTLLGALPSPWRIYDLERASDARLIAQDPDLFLRLNPDHVAIDEAQLQPALFPALRVAIDDHRQQAGRFVITGSSSPDLIAAISESLAGRTGVIELSPLSWPEASGRVDSPFIDLLIDRADPRDFVERLTVEDDLQAIHTYWFRGGYPEPWIKASDRFRRLWMDQYVQTYLYRDVARLFPGLNAQRFHTFMYMLSGLSGTILNYSDIARSLSVSAPTAREYIDIAHGTFLWRKIPAFERHTLKRVVRHPRGYMRDSGLLHHLMHIPDLEALIRHPQMGRSWEGMVIEEMIRGLNIRGERFEYAYYRTGAGAEVDLVLEGAFGLIPIEIKYAQSFPLTALRPIRDFIAEQGCRIGVVITNDQRVRRYDEKLIGIPFSAL